MMKTVIWIVVTGALWVSALSCGTRGSRTPVAGPGEVLVSVGDTVIAVPTGYAPEDSIAYIENVLLRHGSITTDQLLGLTEIHTLDPDSLHFEYYTPMDMDALKVANRFMRMHHAASGNADDELAWVDAVRTILADYCIANGRSKEEALEDLLSAIGYLSVGAQFEMNRYAYVEASVEYFRALDANKAFLEAVPDGTLRDLLTEEYRCWNRLNETRFSAYVNIIRSEDHYSMLPMELEFAYGAYAKCRREFVEVDRSIVDGGRKYALQHPVVRMAQWNAFLSERLWLPEGYDTIMDDNEHINEDVALQFKQAVEAWLDARHAVTRYYCGDKGESYDNAMADYHWVVVNSADDTEMD